MKEDEGRVVMGQSEQGQGGDKMELGKGVHSWKLPR